MYNRDGNMVAKLWIAALTEIEIYLSLNIWFS